MADGTADELAKLARLHSEGSLTDQEFEWAKARALGGVRLTTSPAAEPVPVTVVQPKTSQKDIARAIGCVWVFFAIVALIAVGFWIDHLVTGTAKFRATVQSYAPVTLDGSKLGVTLKLTNTGKKAGVPRCSVQATSPGDSNRGSAIDFEGPHSVSPGGTIYLTGTLTITQNGAANIDHVTASC